MTYPNAARSEILRVRNSNLGTLSEILVARADECERFGDLRIAEGSQRERKGETPAKPTLLVRGPVLCLSHSTNAGRLLTGSARYCKLTPFLALRARTGQRRAAQAGRFRGQQAYTKAIPALR